MENEKELKNTNNKRKSDVVITVILSVLCIFMLVIILLNIFVFTNVTVSGNSMENTLESGDVIYFNKYGKVDRGDVVVIDKGPYWIIKRVIAVGGDTVKIKDGNVYINGDTEPLTEEYVKGINYSDIYTHSFEEKTWTVGEDEIFYLGDNRSVSIDSRTNGTVRTENILGTVSGFAIKTKGIKTFFSNLFGPNCGNITGD